MLELYPFFKQFYLSFHLYKLFIFISRMNKGFIHSWKKVLFIHSFTLMNLLYLNWQSDRDVFVTLSKIYDEAFSGK